jgi:localization factor PodJL
MSGSRSNPTGTADLSSLDALSRTIEGLEARIEGLMDAASRDTNRQRAAVGHVAVPERNILPVRPPVQERIARAERDTAAGGSEPPHRPERVTSASPSDPLAEIRQRQRALEASRERQQTLQADAVAERPVAAGRREHASRQPLPSALRPAAESSIDIAQALVDLRQDLKRDIADGIAREVSALRAEIRDIRSDAEDSHFAEDVRHDMARLADSIDRLSVQPETDGLKAEFEDLRSLMDGLAREESLHHVSRQMQSMDTAGLQDELVALAHHLDAIKQQLGQMSDNPTVRALEDKLLSIANTMESLGDLMQPHGRVMTEQFSALDMRLDELSRAIAANGRSAQQGADATVMQRLENRIGDLSDQIDLMSRDTARHQPSDELSTRLEALAMRIDEFGHAKAASRLEERLDLLSHLVERSHVAAAQPDLADHLTDISRKIDALEHGSVDHALAERLDYLARRIDEIDRPAPSTTANLDDGAVRRLEGRLSDIAARLEASTAAPPTDAQALRSLEDQIAHLSSLLMSESRGGDHIPADFDRRMSAIEDYMTTNDEYVIEAARHAAETVIQAYSREGMGGQAAVADMSAMTALAEDLRHLEDLSRDSEERTHRTFEALHDTLLQIADRLDHMEHGPSVRTMPAAAFNDDVFAHAHAYAEAPGIKPSAMPPGKAGPVIRTVAAVEPAIAVEPVAPRPIDALTKAEIKADANMAEAKPGLFASLGKRFFSIEAGETPFPPDRPVIAPVPSIDPVDVMPADAANELLEPGSGAPDIKKILERVRASQNAARNDQGKAPSESDRADYIAAARRAAQAAAMEIDQTQRAAPAMKGDGKKASAFARFRRPILLAVGAALLAIMSYPLVHTLTHGQKAPPPAEVSALSSTADTAPMKAGTTKSATALDQANAAAQAPAAQSPAPQPADAGATAAASTSPAPAVAPPTDHLTSVAPLDTSGANGTLMPTGSAPAQQTANFVPAAGGASTSSPAAAAPPAGPAIAVPGEIQPPSLAAAAKSGDPVALFEVGVHYTDGRGVTADLKQAASWYQRAADKGYAPAQYRLASMYEKGNGLDRDLAKARQYYELAADQGNASAMHNLAVLYASGTVGQQDYAKAATWFTKAANLGISDSQFNLAILYARGNGVKQDLQESYKWFAIAAKSGDKDAAQKRDEVANAMKPDQLQAARAKADLWKAEPSDAKANGADIPEEWSTGKGVNTASIDMKKAIRNIQAILNNNGFDAGKPDGDMGEKTVAALKNFQKSVGLPTDGKVTDQVVKALLARNK